VLADITLEKPQPAQVGGWHLWLPNHDCLPLGQALSELLRDGLIIHWLDVKGPKTTTCWFLATLVRTRLKAALVFQQAGPSGCSANPASGDGNVTGVGQLRPRKGGLMVSRTLRVEA
jgi:hypothetical protein